MIKVSWGAKQHGMLLEAAAAEEEEEEEEEEDGERRLEGLQVPVRLMHQHNNKKNVFPYCLCLGVGLRLVFALALVLDSLSSWSAHMDMLAAARSVQ